MAFQVVVASFLDVRASSAFLDQEAFREAASYQAGKAFPVVEPYLVAYLVEAYQAASFLVVACPAEIQAVATYRVAFLEVAYLNINKILP